MFRLYFLLKTHDRDIRNCLRTVGYDADLEILGSGFQIPTQTGLKVFFVRDIYMFDISHILSLFHKYEERLFSLLVVA